MLVLALQFSKGDAGAGTATSDMFVEPGHCRGQRERSSVPIAEGRRP